MLAPSLDGKRRVCLVTAEFHGLFKNGGIGTANTGLALTLAEAGHEVTVAYVDAGLVDFDERVAAAGDTIAAWAKRGVTLEFVPRNPLLRAGHEDHVAASFTVFQFLQGRGFEVVFFNECGGQGYFSALAKRAGLFADAPRMICVTHGSNAWVLELNSQLYWGLHPISVDFLERRSVELADDVVSPSRYLVGWMTQRGWRLPASTRVIQNALPVEPAAAPPAPAPVAEVVFFGRLEARKGVDLFLSAYSRLCATRDMAKVKVTFLGKFARIEGVHSGVYVLERTRTWPVAPTLITELGQEQALKYLSRPGVLAVTPSRAENSPCVVAECLLAGVAVVATDSGGTAELIAPGDRERALCANTPESLAARIAAALDGGPQPAAMAVPQEQSRRAWLDLLSEPPKPPAPAPAPLAASLCLAPAAPLAPEAWRAFLAQDFAEIVVVTAEAGGLPDDARIRRIVAPGLSVAQARNLAAEQARGPWLMFAHERDVVLKPQALAGFLSAAHGLEAEIVTSPSLEFTHAGAPRDGWDGFIGLLPTGSNLTLAAFENCLGEGCFLIDRARFLAVGGFAAEASEALRDRLLLTQAALAGARLEVAPTPLFWRREAAATTLAFGEASADQRRLLQAYGKHEAELLGPALESVLATGPRTRDRVTAALSGLGAAAREMALKLSFMPQRDSTEQNRPFLDYCLARGRLAEAFAFAQWLDDPELAVLARAGAEAAAEKAALGALREPVARTRSVALMRIAAERARGVVGVAEGALRNEDGRAIAHPLSGVAVVKAAGICPPGARRLSAAVSAPQGVRVALVACDRFALLRLDGDTLAGEEPFAWTGWRPPGEIALDLPTPFTESADLLLLSKGEGPVVWSALAAEVALFDFNSSSLIQLDSGVTPLPRRFLSNAELLTPAADFPGPYFVAGSPTMHHPLVDRPALVRLRHALFQGATGVRALFSVENEQSRPIEFGLWVRRAGAAVREVEGLADSLRFSGWTAVREPFRQYRLDIDFPEPLRQPHDLYLATRVVEFHDNNYCHAVWRDIFVIEATPRAG
ncbi:MAG: glycosyltransferase [Pseudomonadota bacterium]|nr:glycosyltransferase [Pseudomonadota bacterium]